jgi:hypothetical protein
VWSCCRRPHRPRRGRRARNRAWLRNVAGTPRAVNQRLSGTERTSLERCRCPAHRTSRRARVLRPAVRPRTSSRRGAPLVHQQEHQHTDRPGHRRGRRHRRRRSRPASNIPPAIIGPTIRPSAPADCVSPMFTPCVSAVLLREIRALRLGMIKPFPPAMHAPATIGNNHPGPAPRREPEASEHSPAISVRRSPNRGHRPPTTTPARSRSPHRPARRTCPSPAPSTNRASVYSAKVDSIAANAMKNPNDTSTSTPAACARTPVPQRPQQRRPPAPARPRRRAPVGGSPAARSTPSPS